MRNESPSCATFAQHRFFKYFLEYLNCQTEFAYHFFSIRFLYSDISFLWIIPKSCTWRSAIFINSLSSFLSFASFHSFLIFHSSPFIFPFLPIFSRFVELCSFFLILKVLFFPRVVSSVIFYTCIQHSVRHSTAYIFLLVLLCFFATHSPSRAVQTKPWHRFDSSLLFYFLPRFLLHFIDLLFRKWCFEFQL